VKGKAHTDEVRAQVIAALLAGQGVSEVARAYKVPKATVSRIKNELTPKQLEQIGTEKRERIGDLIEGHLSESLKAAATIARKTNDDAWLTKQNAADIAVFYGVLTDKAVRILEAAESAREPEGEGEAPEGA
jgi:transposase-like protein